MSNLLSKVYTKWEYHWIIPVSCLLRLVFLCFFQQCLIWCTKNPRKSCLLSDFWWGISSSKPPQAHNFALMSHQICILELPSEKTKLKTPQRKRAKKVCKFHNSQWVQKPSRPNWKKKFYAIQAEIQNRYLSELAIIDRNPIFFSNILFEISFMFSIRLRFLKTSKTKFYFWGAFDTRLSFIAKYAKGWHNLVLFCTRMGVKSDQNVSN